MKINRYTRPHRADRSKPVFIYCLWCPTAKRVRYIGKSTQPQQRVYLHLLAAARRYHDHHTSRWLRKLMRSGTEPRLRVILSLPHDADWQTAERGLIARALSKGWPLTNQSAGGEGVVFLSEEDENRANDIRRTANRTEKARRAHSEGAKKAWADPEKRARITSRQKEAANLPDRRVQLSMAGKMRTPEGELRRLEAVKRYNENRVKL